MHEQLSHRRTARLALALAIAFAAPLAPRAQTGARQEQPKGDAATRARRVGERPAAAKESPAGDAKPKVEEKKAKVEEKKAKVEEKKANADANRPSSAENRPSSAEDKSAAGEKKRDAEKSAPSAKAATPKVETPEVELSRRRAEIAGAAPEDRARLRRALVDRLVGLDMKGEALEELRQMIHEDRFDPAFFYNTGNALARLGDANAATDAYRKAVSQRRGNYARALNNLGVVLTRQGRWDEAYDALVAALTQENFTYAEASYNLGRLYLLRGEANLAIREWTRTLTLDPDHVEAASALALAYAEDGNEKRGLAVLSNFTARSARTGGGVPREIAAAREEINAGLEPSQTFDDARGGANALRTGEPVPSPASPATGAGVSSSSRAISPSRTASRGGLRALSVDAGTYEMLQSARSAGESGKNDEAIRRYRSALARSGGYLPPANLELAAALINLKRDEEAVPLLTAVTERDDARYPVAHYHLARLYERRGQLEQAARQFARAAELYGDTAPQMMFDLSRLREKLGDSQGALAAMEAYVASIGRQGSVPDWATERVNTLREKAKSTTTPQPAATSKP